MSTSADIPLYIEFTPAAYKSRGTYELLMKILESTYTKAIFMPEATAGHPIVHSVAELWNFMDKTFLMDIFFIK